jgi:hypothetical protein
MKQKELSKLETSSTRVERLPDMVASDFNQAAKWIKNNPVKATAIGIISVVALRNKVFRSVLTSAAIAFLSTKVANKVEHTLH